MKGKAQCLEKMVLHQREPHQYRCLKKQNDDHHNRVAMCLFQLVFQEKQFLNVKTKSELKLKNPVGCENCNYIGYKGRVGIYELIQFDSDLRTMVHDNASEVDMLKLIRKTSTSLSEDGKRLVLNGDTTIVEVMRVTSSG